MKYYKIVNPKGHRGLVYKEGLNIDPLPFNPSGSCEPGGIYFTSKDIFAFYNYGTDVYEVNPVGEIYKDYDPRFTKWKAHAVKLKYIGKIYDIDVIKNLIKEGANYSNAGKLIDVLLNNNNLPALKYLIEEMHSANIILLAAVADDHLDIIKYVKTLIETFDHDLLRSLLLAAIDHNLIYNTCYIIDYLCEFITDTKLYDICLKRAAIHSNYKLVKYFVNLGANVNNGDLLYTVVNNRDMNILEYLVENGADVTLYPTLLTSAYSFDTNNKILKYLIEQGIPGNTDNSGALRKATYYNDFTMVKYLVEHGADIYDRDHWDTNNSIELLQAAMKNTGCYNMTLKNQKLISNYFNSIIEKDKNL